MQLRIARHGETEYNTKGIIQGGNLDSPLTAKGIAQAKDLGKSLEGITFDAVYSSPQKRATDTVEIAFGGRYKPITDPRIVEVGVGAAEGMPWDDLAEAFPESAYWLSDPVNFPPPPKGESMTDMMDRVSAFMDDVSKAGHQNVFVLAHGYVLRVFQACTMGKTVEAVKQSRSYQNCEVAHYQFKDNKWELISIKFNGVEV